MMPPPSDMGSGVGSAVGVPMHYYYRMERRRRFRKTLLLLLVVALVLAAVYLWRK